jgi:hypothetical protein
MKRALLIVLLLGEWLYAASDSALAFELAHGPASGVGQDIVRPEADSAITERLISDAVLENPSSRGEIAPEPSERETVAYTGIVIDARGFRPRRAITIRLITPTGRIVYDGSFLAPGIRETALYAQWSAIRLGRAVDYVESHPLMIQPLRLAPNERDYVVSEEVGVLLARINQRTGLLTQGRVVVGL